MQTKQLKFCNYDKNIKTVLLELSATPNKNCWRTLVSSDSKPDILCSSIFDKDRWRETYILLICAERL